MANTKMQLQYRVTNGYNPVTKRKVLRPVIANRKKMNLDQIVEYCLNAGFVRGQFHDMRGNLNGFIEGMQQLGRDGHDLNLADWFRIHAELTKTVDETRQLTSKNELRVNVTVLKELKRSAADFSWTNIDDNSANPKIAKVTYLGGSEDKLVFALFPIVFTGTNLTYHEGDKTTATYKDAEGVEHIIDMGAPAEFTDGHQKYEPIEEFKTLEDETEIEFAFFTRGGIKDAPEKVTRRKAKLIADKTEHNPKIVSVVSGMNGREGQVRGFEDTLTITGEDLSFDGVKFRYVMIGADGEVKSSTRFDRDGDIVTYLSPTCVQFKAIGNYSDQPTDNWISDVISNEKYLEARLKDGTILRYPVIFVGED